MQWHRIDDPENPPPKDGTRILGYQKIRDSACINEIWWEPDYMEGEWGERFGGWDDDWDQNISPTHWMPLPPPPEAD